MGFERYLSKELYQCNIEESQIECDIGIMLQTSVAQIPYIGGHSFKKNREF